VNCVLEFVGSMVWRPAVHSVKKDNKAVYNLVNGPELNPRLELMKFVEYFQSIFVGVRFVVSQNLEITQSVYCDGDIK